MNVIICIYVYVLNNNIFNELFVDDDIESYDSNSDLGDEDSEVFTFLFIIFHYFTDKND